MDYSYLLNTSLLKEALKIVEEKQAVEARLKEVEAKLKSFGGGTLEAKSSGEASAPKPGKRKSPRVKASGVNTNSRKAADTQGSLKQRVVALLKAAGAGGALVTDLASALGLPPANLHVWFSTTGKKNPSINKVARGRYAWHRAAKVAEHVEGPAAGEAEPAPTEAVAAPVDSPASPENSQAVEPLATEVAPAASAAGEGHSFHTEIAASEQQPTQSSAEAKAQTELHIEEVVAA